ncbi:MAG: hypothetical protein HC853_03625, partial [Anaerolineae bacterium]|nr:hypothetical protein [Anaerolineae bacterium]
MSITVGFTSHSITVPFMDGEIELAPGPIRLATQCSAPILPVFTVREEDGTFVTEIRRLDLPQRKLDAAVMRGVYGEFSNMLEEFASRYPDQYDWQAVKLRTSLAEDSSTSPANQWCDPSNSVR